MAHAIKGNYFLAVIALWFCFAVHPTGYSLLKVSSLSLMTFVCLLVFLTLCFFLTLVFHTTFPGEKYSLSFTSWHVDIHTFHFELFSTQLCIKNALAITCSYLGSIRTPHWIRFSKSRALEGAFVRNPLVTVVHGQVAGVLLGSLTSSLITLSIGKFMAFWPCTLLHCQGNCSLVLDYYKEKNHYVAKFETD